MLFHDVRIETHVLEDTPWCNLDGDEHRASFEVRSTEVIKAYAAFEPRFAFTLVPEKRPIEGFDLWHGTQPYTRALAS